MNRADVLQTAFRAVEERLSRDWFNQLKEVARQYGKHHNKSAAIENWLGAIEDTDFTKFFN